MHSVDFFRRRGFYCHTDFLDGPTRTALLEQLRGASPTPAKVFNDTPDAVVDMAVRNTWEVPLVTGAVELAARLDALRTDLAAHFQMPLQGHEGPTCLLYKRGGYYEQHVDRAGDDEEPILLRRRRVSAVMFLNAMSPEPGPGDYSGGALTFYGLLDDPAWRTFGFGLEPTAGLLVAFPSQIVHEVMPVTAGERYTIVDWFTT